jgi:hypothetical protein
MCRNHRRFETLDLRDYYPFSLIVYNYVLIFLNKIPPNDNHVKTKSNQPNNDKQLNVVHYSNNLFHIHPMLR